MYFKLKKYLYLKGRGKNGVGESGPTHWFTGQTPKQGQAGLEHAEELEMLPGSKPLSQKLESGARVRPETGNPTQDARASATG